MISDLVLDAEGGDHHPLELGGRGDEREVLLGQVQQFSIDLQRELRRGPVVLYFFPKAFTSGCTAEAHAFSEAIDDFKKAGAQVIGLPDAVEADIAKADRGDVRIEVVDEGRTRAAGRPAR